MASITTSKKAGIAHQATTPRAAAVAGILFAVLFGTSIVLVRLSLPADSTDMNAMNEVMRGRIGFAQRLIPFAGICFLWFVGVVRDRLGEFEDKFFSTVTLGSGLLFLATCFIAFAMTEGMILTENIMGIQRISLDVYVLDHLIIGQIFNVYAIKMAAVFMFSLSTLWQKTGVMPRRLSLLTYTLVAIMLLSLSRSLWMALIFPAWVLIVSIYTLILNYRRQPGGFDGQSTQLSSQAILYGQRRTASHVHGSGFTDFT